VIDDLPARYDEYLKRFATEIGEVAAGGFAKYNGRLVKKLGFEDFTPAYLEYTGIARSYQESLDRGDTINDLVIKLLREQSASLILKPPA